MTEPKPLFRKKIDEIDNIIIRKNKKQCGGGGV